MSSQFAILYDRMKKIAFAPFAWFALLVLFARFAKKIGDLPQFYWASIVVCKKY